MSFIKGYLPSKLWYVRQNNKTEMASILMPLLIGVSGNFAKLSPSQPANPQLGAEIALLSVKSSTTPILVVLGPYRGTGNLVSIVEHSRL